MFCTIVPISLGGRPQMGTKVGTFGAYPPCSVTRPTFESDRPCVFSILPEMGCPSVTFKTMQ